MYWYEGKIRKNYVAKPKQNIIETPYEINNPERQTVENYTAGGCGTCPQWVFIFLVIFSVGVAVWFIYSIIRDRKN